LSGWTIHINVHRDKRIINDNVTYESKYKLISPIIHISIEGMNQYQHLE
jgi:hypothetical protein